MFAKSSVCLPLKVNGRTMLPNGPISFTMVRVFASTTDIVNPNADFLYSQAWLDLSKGPVVLTIPDTKGRYYLLALLDAYTNVAASIGKRTTGTEKRQFAIVGPHFKGTLPEGTSVKYGEGLEVKSSPP